MLKKMIDRIVQKRLEAVELKLVEFRLVTERQIVDLNSRAIALARLCDDLNKENEARIQKHNDDHAEHLKREYDRIQQVQAAHDKHANQIEEYLKGFNAILEKRL